MTDRGLNRRSRSDAPRRRGGWTLLECVLVVAIMGLAFACVAPLLHSAAKTYDAADPRILMVQEARFALAHVATALRTARAVTAFSDGGDGTASLEFVAFDGTAMTLKRTSGSDELRFGVTGSEGVLGKRCSGLAVRCYDADGTALSQPLAWPGLVATVEMAVTVSDPDGRLDPATITTRAGPARSRPEVVINELMYHSDQYPRHDYEWVELLNLTDSAIDLEGWAIWTKDESNPDTIHADTAHGGSSVIPAGGYAVVTTEDSALYVNCVTNGSFESGLSGWSRDFGDYDIDDDYDPPDGDDAILIYYHTWARLWQTFDVPAGANLTFSFWERRPWGCDGGRVRVELIEQPAGPTYVVYDDQVTWGWDQRIVDVSYLAGKTVKIRFMYCPNNWTEPWAFFDGIKVSWSPFPAGCARLCVHDDDIGLDLDDKEVYFGNGTRMYDAVVFEHSWGGDDNGDSLARTSPYAPATEQASWAPGPDGGTPGGPNP